MSKFSKKNYSLVTPVVISAVVAASALISGVANAETQPSSKSTNADALVEQVQLRPNAVSQNVTSVSQLSDVRPTDWAFTALQSLVERYGCIAGYPDRTFRGKQATSRYEFAAGLNACLDKINEIISAGLADKVSKQDLATLQKLQEEFAAELATLRGRVDALDAKTAKLEAQQFSTTTKLRGEAIFGLAAASDGVGAPFDRTNTIFSYRARLNLDTSFTGKDLLRTRLQASNTPNIGPSLNNGVNSWNANRLSYESGRSENNFEINRLSYRFPVGDNITAYIAPIGAPEDVISPLNPIESDSQGTISRTGRFNPLIRIASSGRDSGLAVAGLTFKFNNQAALELMYSAANAATPSGQGGLSGSDTKLAAQLVLKPSEAFTVGLGYANAYTVGNTLSSGLNVDSIGASPSPFNASPAGITGIKTDTVVGSLIFDITKKITLSGWYSASFATATGIDASTTFTNWLAVISGKDLFTEGDLAAVSFGQPLLRTNVAGVPLVQGSLNTPYHLETFYRFRVSKNISITPGVFFVFNQNSSSANGTATVGVLRTTFSF